MDSAFAFQQAVIEREIEEIENARAQLPSLEFPRWHDSASVAYALHLFHLLAQAEALLATLRQARHEARLAAMTMEAR